MEGGRTGWPADAVNSQQTPLLSMEDVRVTYDVTVALDVESFEVCPGEIIGLVGHNGAGKSTLVNVASGAVRPDRRTMTVAKTPAALGTHPRRMEELGVKVIHQDPAVVPNLSIADNITLARAEARRSRTARRQIAREPLILLGSHPDVDRPVSTLQFGQRQIVDLARAMHTETEDLFLDEPTAIAKTPNWGTS